MTSGISRSKTALGLIHMTDTASSARLVFASATTSPNLSISGSFWNCGAPPDSEIAVAIVSAPITTATSIAAKAANQSTAPGGPANVAMRWNTARVTTAMRAKFARLNAILTMDWRAVTRSATPDPARTASRYSLGVTKKSPMTAGTSLSENECVSRRKWTRMTFVSARRQANASTGQGMWTGLATGSRWRT